MKFQEILELIDKIAERGIHSVEIEQAGTKVRIEGKSSTPQVFHSYLGEMKGESALPSIPIATLPSLPEGRREEGGKTAEEESDAGLHIIPSPIVGTFYRSPSPDSQPFVNVGDRISKGKVLCIIEAMKLMNEIESDVDGVIARIYPQNGQPIEYGEKLFAVRT